MPPGHASQRRTVGFVQMAHPFKRRPIRISRNGRRKRRRPTNPCGAALDRFYLGQGDGRQQTGARQVSATKFLADQMIAALDKHSV